MFFSFLITVGKMHTQPVISLSPLSAVNYAGRAHVRKKQYLHAFAPPFGFYIKPGSFYALVVETSLVAS
jgi:hypothetical protein